MIKILFKKRIVLHEIIGFSLIIIMVWADEMFDLSALITNTKPTPINWIESLIESIVTLLVAIVTILMTQRLLKKTNIMEGLLNVCYMCKKIKGEKDNWLNMESYVQNHTNVNFSHGLCPECYKKYYKKLVK